MRLPWSWLAGLLVLALVGGCTAMKPAEIAPPTLDGSAWVLAELPGTALVPGAPATLRFEAGRAQGSDGCNRFSTGYRASGSSIGFDPRAATTQMACPPAVTRQAEAFMAALSGAGTYRIEDGRLKLQSADGTLRAAFAAQPQTLAGTSWRATGINNGRQAVVSLLADSSVTLDFGADGQASGSAGCNRYTAKVEADGARLRFQTPAATRRMCAAPGLMEQEQAFLKALEGVRTMRIEGSRLELRDDQGALMATFVNAVAP